MEFISVSRGGAESARKMDEGHRFCMYGYLGFDGLDGWSCRRNDIGG